MRSTRSERASGGRTPGTTCWRSGQVNNCGGIGGGTCVTPPEAAGRSRPDWSVVCMRLIICMSLAVVARFCACAVSSSDAADACTARDSLSKKRLLGSRFWLPWLRFAGCVTSSCRARTTSACSASSSSDEMKEADWKTVATGEQMLPAASGCDLKKSSEE